MRPIVTLRNDLDAERQHYSLTLGVLTLAATAYALQQTMVVPALPALQRELDASTTWVTWVLTGFLLSAAVLTPILGKLGDRFGKERLLVLSLVVPQNLRVPIDGDEPFYLLITESIVHDFDLDLSNQYRTLERSETGRRDLKPQFGDPTGPNGQQYSRHEPFLALLLIPGYLLAGLPGAVATLVLFGAESQGLPDEVVALAQAELTVPSKGQTQSLNLSVALGIVAFEANRQLASRDRALFE